MQEQDYKTIARSRLTDRHRSDEPFLAILDTLIELKEERQREYLSLADTFLDIDKSTGKNLDVIGRLIGEERTLVNFIDRSYFGFLGARLSEAYDFGYWYSLYKNKYGTLRTLTDEEYQRLKEYEPQSIEEEALKAFVGYGCSFGGKWFGGRARGGVNADGTPRNHVAESSRAIQKQAQFFGDHVSFDTQDYRNINPSSGDIVYCDPPYRNTTEYKTQFNHDEFWEWANCLVDRGVIVYVSEVSAPEGWKSVWSVSQHRSVKRAGDITTVEKLYTRGDS